MYPMAAAQRIVKAVVVRIAKFTYTRRGGGRFGGVWKRVGACRITANYASKVGGQVVGSGLIGAGKRVVFRRITGAAPGGTEIFWGACVLAPRKLLSSL